jgi:hypothetical protein
LRDYCRETINEAAAMSLEDLGGFGTSFSTGENTYYNYYAAAGLKYP